LKKFAGKTLKKALPKKKKRKAQIMRIWTTTDASLTWKTDPDFSSPEAAVKDWTQFPPMDSPQSVPETGRWTELRRPQMTKWEQTAR